MKARTREEALQVVTDAYADHDDIMVGNNASFSVDDLATDGFWVDVAIWVYKDTGEGNDAT